MKPSVLIVDDDEAIRTQMKWAREIVRDRQGKCKWIPKKRHKQHQPGKQQPGPY